MLLYKNAKVIALLLTNYLLITTHSQDLHFSQYLNAPLLTNPANTGFSPECDYRVGVNSRTQWAGTNVPYKTNSFWADAQLSREKIENGWLGLGGVVLTDVAGSGNLSSTKAYLNIAYHQLLNDNNLLSFGLSGGWVQKRIDFSKLTFNDQWNSIKNFFDVNVPTQEQFVANNTSYIDLNVGINYAWFAGDNFYLNTGVSMMHLNRPSETFFSQDKVDARLSPRYNAFVNASVKLNEVFILNPHIYYSQMSTSTETVIGFDGKYNLSGEGGRYQLLFGAYYRNKDAVIPVLGFQVSNLQLAFNYDVTTSALQAYSVYKSAYELSVVWNGIYGGINKSERAVRCSSPKF